jgi:exo-beta-1,3-glucanase (GH17 family)
VAENVNWWIHKGERLAKEIDFIGVHSYPLWEGQDINVGLSYTINNLKAVKKALPESKIVITEAGWATIAVEFGERASEEKQLRYYNELYVMAEKLNITTFFFEAFDEPWKGETDNADGAEKNWGIFNVDRTPKLVMQELYPELMKSK